MATSYHLSHDALAALFAAIRADGRRILAPVDRDGRTELQEVAAPADVAQGHLQTILSAKETVFPKVERILSYTTAPGQVTLTDPEPAAAPTVLFGVRPCEATAFRASSRRRLGAVSSRALISSSRPRRAR